MVALTHLAKRSSLTGGCALLLATGFLGGWLWPVSLAGLVGAMWLLSKSDKLSTKAFLVQCALFGYVFLGVVLNWIYGINTTDLIADTFFAWLFLGLSFLLMVGALAIGFVLFGLLYCRLKVSTSNHTILYIPALWAVSEWFRSVFFSAFSMGSGGSVGPYWNFGVLGFAFMQTPLAYASRIVGLYGMSFLVVLVAVVIYQLLQKRYRYAYVLAIPVALSLAGWGLYRESHGTQLQVGAVGIRADIDNGYQDDLDQKLTRLPSDLPDALVLPEYSYYFVDSGGKKTDRKLPVAIPLVIDSSSQRVDERIENQVSYNQPDGTPLAHFQKNFLIPGGEYIPYLYEAILFYSGNHSIIRSFETDKAVRSAKTPEQTYAYRDVTYGALACSGAIAPELYRGLAHSGAEILTNSASISTLGVSDAYYGQASQMSAFIAVSNAKPFVQAARGGPSYILDKDRNQLAYTNNAQTSDIVTASVQTNRRRTLYSQLGEWVVWLSIAGIAVLLVHKSTH